MSLGRMSHGREGIRSNNGVLEIAYDAVKLQHKCHTALTGNQGQWFLSATNVNCTWPLSGPGFQVRFWLRCPRSG